MTVAQTQSILGMAFVSREHLLPRGQSNTLLGRWYLPEMLGSTAHCHGWLTDIFEIRQRQTLCDIQGPFSALLDHMDGPRKW